MRNRSVSRIPRRSWPNTRTLPASGSIRPSAVFSSTVLPLPAAPKMTRVSPLATSKETSSSALLSLKRTLTCSNRRTDWDSSCAIRQSQAHENSRDKEREEEDQHRRHHHRLRGGAAYALRAAGCGQTVIA